jgi:glyoxylase I family protein
MPGITGVFYVGLTVRDVGLSAEWYARLFEFEVVRRHTDDDGELDEVLLRDHGSGFELGLVSHRDNPGEPFSEFRTGLDHLEFGVASGEELEAWAHRLDGLGVAHSGIKDLGSSALVTFRDPDNIQLEFYWRKPHDGASAISDDEVPPDPGGSRGVPDP